MSRCTLEHWLSSSEIRLYTVKSRRTTNNKMFGVFLLAVIAGLLPGMHGLPVGFTEKNTGAVFVSQQEADTVLRRQRRYNSGHLEEVLQANLERECREETCTMEEAREYFEDNEKTMVTSVSRIPARMEVCVRTESVRMFAGANQTLLARAVRSVSVDLHLLNTTPTFHFKKSTDIHSVSRGPFRCGKVELDSTSTSATRSIISPRSLNIPSNSERSSNSNNTLQESYYLDNLTDIYDYYDSTTSDSELTNTSIVSAIDIRSLKSDSNSSMTVLNSSNITETPTEKKQPPPWAFFPTLPTITGQVNNDQRIVGGDEATPGEIPWQVTLMSYSSKYDKVLPFCGGSLLSDVWVISAAHCLIKPEIIQNGYIVRVGEHDVNSIEGPESDHEVAVNYTHPSYNHSKSLYNNDIVLLKLKTPVILSNQRRPICLGPKDFTEDIMRESKTSLVSGWGALRFLGLTATKLQKLEVPYVERTVCKQSSRDHVTRFMFCAGYPNELKDSCQGDSGGPHATHFKGTWFLTGIVSWGEECAKEGKYGIYTRISRYYNWISKTTGIQVSN
ncbi:Coagulation factor IX [Channa argus]|uniref:Coagulation factor IX n=1 Tax=Channa argus TaxID=215402 RepID=A0A6G1QT61_CHAAH|nr:Coagulation factor IX [Channa argus]